MGRRAGRTGIARARASPETGHEVNGCDAEGVAATSPSRLPAVRCLISPVRDSNPSHRARVCAMESCMSCSKYCSKYFSKYPLAFAIASALPFAAQAQSSDADALDEVVVTATRTAITTDAALAPVEVIDREAIQRSQATSLNDLLRGRAGINLSNQGGAGKLTSLFLRGAESDQVLVLVDGVRIGSATSGQAAFQDLPVALIDRIEIVRGPRSSLYGSDAIGGVIQIFTRRDKGPAQFRFRVGAGSHGYREGSLGFGGSGERSWFGVDVGLQRTDGIDACRGAGFPVFAGCFVDGQTDRDGYENHSFSARAGMDIGESIALETHALYVSGHSDYDGGFVDSSDIAQQAAGAKLKWKAHDRIDLGLGIGSNKDGSDNFIDGVANGYFVSRRDSASLQADIDLTDMQLLTLGADWLRDRVSSDTVYDRVRRGNRAVFAQYQTTFGANSLQLALRNDDNDQFGSETTGTAAWGLSFAKDWRVTASYGTGFKAPTFNELYFPFSSNPALRPEASKTFEAGIAWRREATGIRLDVFNTSADDLIAFDLTTFAPINIARARLRGAELRVDSTIFGWNLDASASWLDPEDRVSGNVLPRRAKQTARLELDRTFGKFRLGFIGAAEGSRYDNLANTRRLGGFATLDVRGEYAFAADWTLQARIANAFDRAYETAAFYNQPGRELFVTLRFAPVP
jgi:vitamin B12 transporter